MILTARVLNLLALLFTGALRQQLLVVWLLLRLCKGDTEGGGSVQWLRHLRQPCIFAMRAAHSAHTVACARPTNRPLLSTPPAVGMSALLLLYVNWGALQAECLRKDTCDIWEASKE